MEQSQLTWILSTIHFNALRLRSNETKASTFFFSLEQRYFPHKSHVVYKEVHVVSHLDFDRNVAKSFFMQLLGKCFAVFANWP